MGSYNYGNSSWHSWIYGYKKKEGSCLKSTNAKILNTLKGSFGSLFCLTLIFINPTYIELDKRGAVRSCNVCIEEDKRRATIMRFNPDGSEGEIFATGLRNSVGLSWNPVTQELWATDNGRDWLGGNLPPDEVNIIKENKDYGWPYCYGDNIPEPDFHDSKICEDTIALVVELQAHSAPLGLTFYDGKMFPPQYQGDLFVAFHGSWNRSLPTGYKVVRIKLEDGKPVKTEDFAYGWVSATNKFGRPADVLVGDKGGVIYKVTSK